MTEAAGAPPLVFPVGHYLGPHHLEPGGPAAFHLVRVGAIRARLELGGEVAAWGIAHGVVAELDGTPWHRSALLAAGRSGGADLGTAVEALLRDELLVEVDPGGPAAVAFARRYRLRPLLLGLGGVPEPAGWCAIGLPGHAAVTVSAELFELWRWAAAAASLWAACAALAGGGPAPAAEPLLRLTLRRLHHLLAAGVAYLDVAGAGDADAVSY